MMMTMMVMIGARIDVIGCRPVAQSTPAVTSPPLLLLLRPFLFQIFTLLVSNTQNTKNANKQIQKNENTNKQHINNMLFSKSSEF